MDPQFDARISKQAARWRARLLASDCSSDDRAAFDHWYRANPAHAAAYDRAIKVSADIDRLLGSDPRMQALLADALLTTPECIPPRPVVPTPPAGFGRRWALPASLAAMLTMCVVALPLTRGPTRPAQAVVQYESHAVPRSVLLQDGSTAKLDVGTRLKVRMTAERRSITLEAGRALFDVAHDADRPFTVTAATSRTTALGTRFQVQLDPSQVLVTLAEGSVAIDNEAATQVWQEKLRPGEQLQIDVRTASRIKTPVDPSIATSWTRGRLLFRGTRLQDAIDEINRYSARKVRLGDPTLADMQVDGNFIAGDGRIIVDAFAAVLPLSVVDGGERELILFRRYDSRR